MFDRHGNPTQTTLMVLVCVLVFIVGSCLLGTPQEIVKWMNHIVNQSP